jgi:aryl-alcohol dehydrogenase-like predicted oxidoreductase
MQYNLFGNSGMEVSRLGLGTMTFGEKVDQATAQRITDEAIAGGVNLIDTADSYGDSEIVLGHIFKANKKREQIVLCTKVYNRHSNGEHIGRNSRINVTNALNASLARLQVDHVDLLQLHHPDPQTPIDETMMTLDTLVKAGKVRHVGCSNHYAWQIAYSNGIAARLHTEPLISVQSSYNALDRIVEMDLLHFVRKFNIALMVYSPLGAGLLAKDFDRKHPVDEKSRAGSYRGRIGAEQVYTILERLQQIAKAQGVALNQLAILWLLAKPVVSTVLMGGSKPEHFSTVTEIADKTLPKEVVEEIDKLTEPGIYGPFKNQPRVSGPGMARV